MAIPASHFGRLAVGMAPGKGTAFGQKGFSQPGLYYWEVTPLTLDADGVCASQSPTAAGALTLDGALVTSGVAIFDVPRCVSITSAGNDTGDTFTIEGADYYGQTQHHTMIGGDSVAVVSTKAFSKVTAVRTSGASASTVTVGTADTFGAPYVMGRRGKTSIYWNGTLLTSNSGFVAAVTSTPTIGTGDVRGTIAVQSAADAAKPLEVWILIPDTSLEDSDAVFGKTPYYA